MPSSKTLQAFANNPWLQGYDLSNMSLSDIILLLQRTIADNNSNDEDGVPSSIALKGPARFETRWQDTYEGPRLFRDDARAERWLEKKEKQLEAQQKAQEQAEDTPPPPPEPAPQPASEPAPQPAPEPAPQPAPQPAPEPAPEPAPQPAPQPAPEPAPQPAPQPAPEPAPEPAPQPAPQPAPEPAPQPAPQPAPEPAPQPAPQPAPEPAPPPTGIGNTYTSGMDTPNGFNIELEFFGNWTDSQKSVVAGAAEKISDIVTGDVANYGGIDDIYIGATLSSLDGAGGNWGFGGYNALRPDTFIPYRGYLRLDEADIGTVEGLGRLEDLAMHEMLHSMGFGLTWDRTGLTTTVGSDIRFTGTNAKQAYAEAFPNIAGSDPLSSTGVPVETDGGYSSAGKHWDHGTFGSELMTNTLTSSNPFTNLTAAALEDMGYETIWEPTEDPLAIV